MAELDHDLQSIQEARTMAATAHEAQRAFLRASQAEVDRICAAMANAAYAAAERLGRMAVEETSYGVPEHKTLKNTLASKILWDAIKDTPSVGVVRHDPQKKLYDIAWPMGVIAALTPTTNPTSTVIYKTIIAVKARNGIVIAPHPSAVKCCVETARLLVEAGERAGMPTGLVNCMTRVSLPGTQELMRHKHVALILATGGSEMVRAAHSVGKPAYGVGPGNVPAYVDRTADLERAARYIVASKAFDHSVICATEQAVVADRPIAAELEQRMKDEGAFFVDEEQKRALAGLLFSSSHLINPKAVGQSPQKLAEMCGITVPSWARILVARLHGVGREEPLSGEKLTTVLGWYEAEGWEAGCERCLEMIRYGGNGHSLVIHSRDENVIMRFGLEKPVFRIMVNTLGTLGTTGVTTGVLPALTLGSGGVGGAITGDNISVQHLYNVKRLAYELTAPPEAALAPGSTDDPAQRHPRANGNRATRARAEAPVSDAQLQEIVRQALAQLGSPLTHNA